MKMNSPAQKQELLAAIEPLRAKIEHWRKTRAVVGHMPRRTS